MGSRSEVYADGVSSYPEDHEKLYARCEFCGLRFCINNYEDQKPRTPKLWGMVICIESCDPRHPQDRWMKKGARIMQKRRLKKCHAVKLAKDITIAAHSDDEWIDWKSLIERAEKITKA